MPGERNRLQCKVPMVWGCLSWSELSPLVPVKGNLKATVHDVILDSVLPTLWQQFGEGPLFQYDNARSIQKWFVLIGVEELDWPAQSPGPQLHRTPLE
jgi:hypothetical protein